MNNILTEKQYQRYIIDRLVDNNYIERKAINFDRRFAIDREIMFQFLNDTQPEAMDTLRKIYKSDFEDTLINFLNAEMTKASGCCAKQFEPRKDLLCAGVVIFGDEVGLKNKLCKCN